MKNIKLSILVLTTVFLSTIVFVSCSKDETESKPFDENTISKKLKFVDVNSRIKTNQKEQNKEASLIIVSWDEWGRASKNCDGWGLCNADWFPEFKQAPRLTNEYGGSTLLEFDNKNNKFFIDILLSEKAPLNIPNQALTLKIDLNFQLNVKQIVGRNLTFQKGNYDLNNSLGDFGGYRIYLN